MLTKGLWGLPKIRLSFDWDSPNAHLKLANMQQIEQLTQIYEFGSYRLDAVERQLLHAGEPVPLPPKVFDLLLTLLQHPGQILTKDQLLQFVWPNTVVEEVNLSVTMSALRKALGENPKDHEFIETLPRRGYRFVSSVREASAQTVQSNGSVSHQNSIPTSDSAVIPSAVAPDSRHRVFASGAMFAFALLFIISLAVVVGWRWVSGTATPKLVAPPRIAPFTGAAGRETAPAFSPDGNQIAFVWSGERDDNQDIYVRLIDGGNTLRLTSDPAAELSPAWAPDGRKIAFFREGAEAGIYVVPALGGAERKLVSVNSNRSHLSQQSFLAWAPDGRWLAVVDKASLQEPYSIFLVSPDTGEKRRLTNPPATATGEFAPAFSPDGKSLAFIRSESFALDNVYLVAVSGGEPRQLTSVHQQMQQMAGLAWTADGRELIYSTGLQCGQSLWRIPVNGGQPEWITASGQNAATPAASRTHLAWTQCNIDSNIWRIDLKTATASEQATINLIASQFKDVNASYSPDGKRIAFASSRSGSNEVWVCGSEGERPTQLTFFRGPHAGSPRWSPDGRWISFDGSVDGNEDIFVVSANGGQPRRLTTDPSEEFVPSWSHDGKWVYFNSNRTGSPQLWKLSMEDGKTVVQLTQQGGYKATESVDGQWLYYTKARELPEIWRVPTQGGTE